MSAESKEMQEARVPLGSDEMAMELSSTPMEVDERPAETSENIIEEQRETKTDTSVQKSGVGPSIFFIETARNLSISYIIF